MSDLVGIHIVGFPMRWLINSRFAVDLVVCVALGCDMFDCVYPTRTAVSTLALIITKTHPCMYIFYLCCKYFN